MRLKDHAFSLFLVGVNLALRLPGNAFRIWLLIRVARVDVGTGCAIQRDVKLTGRGGVTIGTRCNINSGVVLDGRGGLTIGSLVNISGGALLLTADHDPRSATFAGRSRSVDLGNRAWIASRAIVLPGTTVGDGAIVAAGAVVHGHVEPWTIVAGNPATVIGTRPPDAQQDMLSFARFLH
jgi:acetyltransferase-like isoleucine patch superfamily enzyme